MTVENKMTAVKLIFVALFTVGCYRMPTEHDYSLIPSTNNPDFTREVQGKNPGVRIHANLLIMRNLQ